MITVVFTITRADEDEDASYTMYSMQNEIEYDDSFVVPMENGCIVRPEIDTEDIALRGNGRAFYMNYLSFVDGSEWNDNQLVGTFSASGKRRIRRYRAEQPEFLYYKARRAGKLCRCLQ